MKSVFKAAPCFSLHLFLILLLVLLSVNTIQAASVIGYWGTGAYRDVQVSDDGSTAVCAAWASGIDIFNIKNPYQPVLLANFLSGTWVISVALKDKRVYAASFTGLEIIDISNPTAPRRLGTYDCKTGVANIHIVKTTAYIVTYHQPGLRIIDVSEPNNIKLLGTYKTLDDSSDVFVKNSTAYIVNEDYGLEIIDVSKPKTPKFLSKISNLDASGIWVDGDLACFCVGKSGFILYGMKDLYNPLRLGTLAYPGADIRSAQIVGNWLYLADEIQGLLIVDISDPRQPLKKSSHDIIGRAKNLAVSGVTALVASSYGGLNLINIANAAYPVTRSRYDHSGDFISVSVAGSIAYLAQGNKGFGTGLHDNGNLQIIDISNPMEPTRLGHFDQPATCVQVVDNTDYAYIGGDEKFRILNVADPANPTETGSCAIVGECSSIEIKADVAYVVDGVSRLRIIDIIDRTDPKITATYNPGPQIDPISVQVINNTAYVCARESGLHIVDVSNPQQPVKLGVYDTPGDAKDVEVVDKIAYVADREGGLQVIDVTDSEKPTRLGSVDLYNYGFKNEVSSIEVIGTYAVVTTLFEAVPGILNIVDISDPVHPQVVNGVKLSGALYGPHCLAVANNKAFVAENLSGRLSIVDLTDVIYNRSIFFPHAACAQGWTTEIALINSSPVGAHGALLAYDDQGTQVGGSLGISLKPNGRRSVIANDAFANADKIGYLVFKSNNQTLVGYTKFRHDNTGYRVALPTVTNVNDSTFYVSHIASDANWWTGIALLNTTDSAKVLTITFSDGQSKSIDLAANEHKSVSIRNLFTETAQPQIDSAVITNCAGVVGFELFGSIKDSRQLSGISLSGKTAETIYYPHIVTDQNWWTGIAAFDPAGNNRTLTITPYSQAGDAFAAVVIDLPMGSKKYLASAGAIGMPAGTAWLQIDAESEITGFELFGNNPSYWLAGYTGVGLEAKKGIFAKLDQGSGFGLQLRQSSSAWTGIALVNSETENAIVLLNARNDDGDLIASTELPLDPHERLMGLAETIFSGKDIGGATYISYESTRKLVGFQMNGDGMLLDALPALKY